ncbi:MAG: Flp pilus assembly complex ATPase component TadA [Magnetococcus sp. DMHC-8]
MSVLRFLQEKWFLATQRRTPVKRLLLLSDQWLTICDWHSGLLTERGRFQQGQTTEQADFAACFRSPPPNDGKIPVYLLVDATEEELRREKIPPLWGANRRAVLERRLERLFPGTPLRRAVSQGRDREGGEWILFSGLTRPDLVTPWLTLLQQAGQPLAGVWSLQLLSRALLRRLTTRSEHALLVGLHSGGLRQTFFHQGRTLISRLTPVADRPPGELAGLLRQEVEKSRGYLNHLRLLPAWSNTTAPAMLDVFVLAQDALLADLADWPATTRDYRVHLHDATRLGQQIGLQEGLPDGALERLHGHLLLQNPEPNHYAPPADLCCHTRGHPATAPTHTTPSSPPGTDGQPSKPQLSAVIDRPVRRLGDLLLEKAIITPDQLQTALTEQKRNGESLGKLLIYLGFITESAMRDLLAESLSQESIDLREVLPQADVLRLIPKSFAQRHGVLPVSLDRPAETDPAPTGPPDGQVLVVAMFNPLNVAVLDKLQALLAAARLPGVTIKPMLAGEGEISAAIDRFYGFELSVQGILREMETGEVDLDSLMRESTDASHSLSHPMVRLVNALLTDAVRRYASDIHIGPTSGSIRIRYRIDGVLRLIHSLHRQLLPSLLVRIKVMAGMNIAESRIPQEGRISFLYSGRIVHFRVSAHPTIHGENLVLRVLDLREEIKGPHHLSLSGENLQRILCLLRRPMGLILVTGPTGSGKTTTLYSMLNHLNREGVNIMTLEDPVEYPLPTISQTHVNRSVGLDYAAGIRSMLWQDPDIILVGEVHDRETGVMALQAAMTGHLVFTTLHANTAIGAIPRLLNLGVTRDFIAGNIGGIIAQRLVRRLCPHCRQTRPASTDEQRLLGMAQDTQPPLLHHPSGCNECHQSGYRGRFPVMEVLLVEEGFDELVHHGASQEQLRTLVTARGFRSMVADARQRILAGETSLEEVSRVLDLLPAHGPDGELPCPS